MPVVLVRVVLLTFAASVIIGTVLVVASYSRVLFFSVRSRHYAISLASLLAILFTVAVSGAVVLVWFGYAVAHSKKSFGDDLRLVLLTGLPFHGAMYGLWRAARLLLLRTS